MVHRSVRLSLLLFSIIACASSDPTGGLAINEGRRITASSKLPAAAQDDDDEYYSHNKLYHHHHHTGVDETGVTVTQEDDQTIETVSDQEGFPMLLEDDDLRLQDAGLPDSLFPLTWRDYLGLICAIAGLCLAAATGMGGGGILIPIYILLLDFPVKHAISLTSVTVLGGSVANNLLNARKRHPDHPHRYCIDWDFILLLEPTTIAGAIVGAVLNDFLPDTVLVVLLLVVLTFTAYKTLTKAGKLRQKESEALAAREAAAAEQTDLIVNKQPTTGSINESSNTAATKQQTYGAVAASSQDTEAGSDNTSFLEEQMKQQEQQQRLHAQGGRAIAKLAGLFAIVTIINLLKGGDEAGGGPAGIQSCGETCFWTAQLFIMVLIAIFVIKCRDNLLARLKLGGPQLSDIHWDERNTVIYPALGIVAGLVAGLFGVGGGLVKGPLMIALDVHPAVASATSACMIFFTSSTATISYSIFGLVVWDYAIAFFLVGFGATLVGQTAMNQIMKRYKRHSYIAYCIGIVVAVSAVCMSIESILALIEEHRYYNHQE